jgi:hypothetical protein
MPDPKRIAAIVTEYRRHSHADVIVGKILEGYNYDGKEKPDLKVVSLYVDQFPEKDMSRDLAKKYDFPIVKTIAEGLIDKKGELAVDGVLCVGEHGKYPTNAKGQILYPRRRFFEEVCKVFEKCKKSVPVFNDKHLAATWEDAKWMYDRSRELYVPFMAGSTVPLTWRKPPLKLEKGCEIEAAVQIGYGPLEGYGFHALEGLQCMMERRKGGETGVKAVQYLSGEEMWKAMDAGKWSKPVMDAALERVPAHAAGDIRATTIKSADACVYVVEYRDGLTVAVPMPNGWIYEGDGGGFTFACKLKGQDKLLSTQFYLQQPDPFAHFSYLVKAFETMVRSGHAVYPIERTLMVTGILDALMTSHAEKNRRVETPHLAIKYQPTEWPFATDPVPKEVKR